MEGVKKGILSDIKNLEIPCPDCKWMYDDDQYTCTTCWCEGGEGKINVFQWIKNNPKVLEDESERF